MQLRNVLVTGCDYGLGLEFVRVLSKDDGVKIIFAGCVDPGNATEIEKLVYESSQCVKNCPKSCPKAKIIPIKLLVDDDESIRKVKEVVESQIPLEGLDLLINNAGINKNDDWLNGIPNRELMLKHFNINSVGPTILAHALLPSLRTAAKLNNRSIILNISSDRASVKVAKTWQEDKNSPSISYGQSKAALNQFTRTLAYYETKNGIISVAMHPGWMRTPMGGPNADLNPTESAEKILRLISNLTVEDSGRYMDSDGKDMEF